MTPPIRSAILIGGGIGGLCAAAALRQIGVEALVYEQAESLGAVGAGLTLWANAIHALRQIGLADQVIAAGSKIQSAAIRTADGRTLLTAQHGELEARFGEPTIAIHRAALHRILIAALPADAVRLNSPCRSFEQHSQGVEARFEDGRSAAGDLIIGADGIHSIVRKQMFPHIRLRYSGYMAWRGVVPTADKLALGATSESWGPGRRFGIVPISAHQVYWFATANTPAGVTDTPTERKRDLCERFAGWHDPIPALLEATPAGDILRNDIFDIRPFKPWSQERAVLLGDAAHPTTPNMGQGACMAIESAVSLARALERERDIPAALSRYESERQPRTAWITNRSWETGRLGQLENPLACTVRNFIIRMTPESVFKSRIAQAAGYKI